jgi:guanine nucleotide-binding protein G(i) subunit alpha
MGNCASSQEEVAAKARSDDIDKQIDEDLRKYKKECKILLLGAFPRSPPPATRRHVAFFPSPRLSALSLHLSRRCLELPADLCAGSGESGKTTIVKQMKIIHQSGFSRDELLAYRPTIYKNLVDSAQAILSRMEKLQLAPQTPENRVRATACPLRARRPADVRCCRQMRRRYPRTMCTSRPRSCLRRTSPTPFTPSGMTPSCAQ